jgi:putative DNA primase/helicase
VVGLAAVLDEARQRATKQADAEAQTAKGAEPPPFYGAAQPSVEDDEYVEPEDAGSGAGDQGAGDDSDEGAAAGEQLDVQLWRVEGALAVVRPIGMAQVNEVGGLLWRLTGGKEKGWECWSAWAGNKADKAKWNEGLRQGRWSLEQLWTVAQRQGWRFPMIVSLNRPDQVAEMAERAMIRGGAGIYQIGLELVTVVTKEVEGTKGRKTRVAVLDPVSHMGLVAMMGNYVHWHKFVKGKLVQAAVPGQVVDVVLARRGRWGFERINGVIMTPTLRRDGSVLKAEGLDAATGLFLLGPVPVIGQGGDTRADAERAIAVLDGLLDEFPFVDAASRSVALSGLITPVIRGACTCVPMHASTAPGAGTGKTYVWDLAGAIAIGDICPSVPAGSKADETEKRLDAELLAGQTLLSIDNVTCDLGNDAMCQKIERPSVKMRVLGLSVTKERRNRWTLFASGSNLRLVDDMTRRVLLCRMDAGCEQAEKRVFQRSPFNEVMANRGRYVWAALTVVRAYIREGLPGVRPRIGEPFAEWSDYVRSALVWLGRADPVFTQDTAREVDPRRQVRAAVFQAIVNAYGYGPKSARPAADTSGHSHASWRCGIGSFRRRIRCDISQSTGAGENRGPASPPQKPLGASLPPSV